jgi:alpha-tubulin suppressor-like RCC1 family protein
VYNQNHIVARQGRSVALKSDGTVVGWGYDGDGRIDIPEGLSDVVAISTGRYHNLALKSDNTVVGWGENAYWGGQIDIPEDLSDVVAISAAHGNFSLALKPNGTVVGWDIYLSCPIFTPTYNRTI